MEIDFNRPELKLVTVPQHIIDLSESVFKKRHEQPWYVMRGRDKYDAATGVKIPRFVDTSRPFVLVEDPYCQLLYGRDMFQADDGRVFRVLRNENI